MAKGRIGLSLSEDVLAILNVHGRGKERGCFFCHGSGKKIGGDERTTGVVECPMCDGSGLAPDSRPTRTEIIERAVRMWEHYQREGIDGSWDYSEPHPSARQHNGTPAQQPTRDADGYEIWAPPPGIDLISKRKPTEAEKARGLELEPLAQSYLRGEGKPLERGKVVPIPKPGKK